MSSVWMPRDRALRTCVAARADVVGAEFEGGMSADVIQRVVVITIRGPLELHPSAKWSSYEDIYHALAGSLDADAIVLDIDSPGGVTGGLIESCRRMRALPLPPIYAVANTMACSAAYALACVADAIYCPASGEVGSIGVYAELWSDAEKNKAEGTEVAIVSSGVRKAEGNRALPLSPSHVALVQADVMESAEQFFDWVAERRGIDARGFEGAAFAGRAAEGLGLTDGVATLADILDAVWEDEMGSEPEVSGDGEEPAA